MSQTSFDHAATAVGTGTAIAIGGSIVVLLWFGLAYVLCSTFGFF
jgi:hypothetical protein